MTNDLKYGLILGGVCILIFIGWLAIRNPGEEGPAVPAGEQPIATEPTDMFAPPAMPSVSSRPPQTAEVEIPISTPAETPSGDVAPPVMPGITAVEYQPSTPAEEPSIEPVREAAVRTYVIKSGDVLSSISQEFYGTTRNWRAIYEANQDVISDPDRLVVGTEIVIPDLAAPEGTRPAERREPSAAERPVETAGRTHKVARGDTLYSIAAKYYGDGNQWRKIYDANKSKIPNANSLSVGTELVIP